MRLLLDTHVLLWIMIEPHRIPARTVQLLHASEGELAFSVACLWEVGVKNGTRRALGIDAPALRARLLQAGLEEIPIRAEHVFAAAALPKLHGDPFDRVMLGQAIAENRILLTADRLLLQYPGAPVRSI